jgi:hypothetical protein
MRCFISEVVSCWHRHDFLIYDLIVLYSPFLVIGFIVFALVCSHNEAYQHFFTFIIALPPFSFSLLIFSVCFKGGIGHSAESKEWHLNVFFVDLN